MSIKKSTFILSSWIWKHWLCTKFVIFIMAINTYYTSPVLFGANQENIIGAVALPPHTARSSAAMVWSMYNVCPSLSISQQFNHLYDLSVQNSKFVFCEISPRVGSLLNEFKEHIFHFILFIFSLKPQYCYSYDLLILPTPLLKGR